MLDKDRIKQVIKALEADDVKRARSLCAEILQEELDNEEAISRRCNPDLIRRGLGKYCYRKSVFNGTGKNGFVETCMPMVIQKALVSGEPDYETAARNLCTLMWEESNAG